MLLSRRLTTMNKNLIYTLIFLLISFVLADTKVFNEFNATPAESNQVIISWKTIEENEIKYFNVKRSNDNKVTFNGIARVTKQGPGYDYQYVDENVLFKSSGIIYYRIDAVSKSGEVLESTGEMMVRPNISGIFKTWGELKAIFR